MKKIILLFALATLSFSANSCSSDDSGSSASSSKIVATIDGVVTTFDNVSVVVDDESFEPEVRLYISATKGNDTNESIFINTWQGMVGTNQLNNLSYSADGKSYSQGPEFNIVIIKNGEDRHLTGTFSGKIKTSGTSSIEKNITAGSFDIKY